MSRIRESLLLSAAWATLSGAVQAYPITFTFSGTVDTDPFGVFDSATYVGSFTFDSGMTQVLNTPDSGGYAGTGGIFNMTVTFTGALDASVEGPYVADTLNITVNNDFPGPLDQYLVTGTSSTDPSLFIELRLEDFTGTAFSDTLLPLTPPDLTLFDSPRFALFGGTLDNPIEAGAVVTGLVAPSLVVPEPNVVLLFLSALAALGVARRHPLSKRAHGRAHIDPRV